MSGSDLADQRAAGVDADPANLELLRARLLKATGLGAGSGAEQVSLALHAALAASPAMLVAATIEDALGVEERTNVPGTVAPGRANWDMALPVPIDSFATHPRMAELASALRRRADP